jgi:hypothetical protein
MEAVQSLSDATRGPGRLMQEKDENSTTCIFVLPSKVVLPFLRLIWGCVVACHCSAWQERTFAAQAAKAVAMIYQIRCIAHILSHSSRTQVKRCIGIAQIMYNLSKGTEACQFSTRRNARPGIALSVVVISHT